MAASTTTAMASKSDLPQQSPTPQLPQLTTRFSQPADCTALFRTANPTPSTAVGFYIVTSDASNPRFSSCQPSAWDQAHFSFSPGLCASSWTYWDMSATVSGTATVSQAFCCAPKYTLKEAEEGQRIRQCALSNSTANDGIAVELRHDAWFVEWQPSDKLSFSLPEIASSTTIIRWIPGNTLPPDSGVPHGQEHDNNGLIIQLILAVVLPVFFVSLFIAACIILIRRRRREKRSTASAQKEQQQK
ncbi:hypothetical protein NQ176_g4678 [Zarea fungicola]|uniref:Uncharacterized protein n=1 Tax=Zarea fungicola TaxID=93591 RepID=A0ACC1NC72_9HYPO|nr:hypothetical protein NQ176_g4678 [Lecanicillium fungicola]